MAFFAKLNDRIGLYNIQQQTGTRSDQLFEERPELHLTAIKQYETYQEAFEAVKVLNDALENLSN